jgi:hypothetical protein
MSAQSYDDKQAYNKGLTAKARFHYLEDSIHDAKKYGKSAANYGSPLDKKGCKSSSPLGMTGSWMSKHCNS